MNEEDIIVGTINIGDFIQFGKYYDEGITWRCIDKNENGTLLLSEYIICFKAYDAAESGVANKFFSSKIGKYGSNKWYNSNLREWLNSNFEAVSYTTAPPRDKALLNSCNNPYVNEKGFLVNFTPDEIELINTVNHDGFLDKVFILSYPEVKKYLDNNHFPRMRKVQTSIPNYSDIVCTEFNSSSETSDLWWYWTRSPLDNSDTSVLVIWFDIIDGGDNFNAYTSTGGVLPALYIKNDNFKSGVGTIDEPYINL